MKSIIVLAFLFMVLSAGAEGKKEAVKEEAANSRNLVLTGRVTDTESGEVLTGVKIELEGTGLSVYTDFDGRYQIDVPESGMYTVKYQMITYKPVEKLQVEVKESKPSNADISLSRL
jgi:hypothetical protein